MNKVAAKRPETKEGGREEEKSRSRIATGPNYNPEGFAAITINFRLGSPPCAR
jgi:hypothetical protein